jgi:hypothetical protein
MLLILFPMCIVNVFTPNRIKKWVMKNYENFIYSKTSAISEVIIDFLVFIIPLFVKAGILLQKNAAKP